MWQCNKCGAWVYQGVSHFCNPSSTSYYCPPPEVLQPTLERIAKALETLVEQNKPLKG